MSNKSQPAEDDLDTGQECPPNTNTTLPFHELITNLFDPLSENRKKPNTTSVQKPARVRRGPHGLTTRSPQEERRLIIERFFSRWRGQVGPDLYPALRLIVPEKDRSRAMYGLKETNIAKILIKIMGISKDGADGLALTNWKVPGKTPSARMAGDFAGRCYEIIKKRPLRSKFGDMTVGQVNDLLDELSSLSRIGEQEAIFRQFYSAMDPTELMWLIRMILRQMKIGASERTFFDVLHPDAATLYSVSSDLEKVCRMCWNPTEPLAAAHKKVKLMQCYQPQLAQFQMHSFDKMVARMNPIEGDAEFYIEEKLDGERIQMHMASDRSVPGGKRFGFWSRKATNYDDLYGDSLHGEKSTLSRYLGEAFHPGVRNIVLDGEMMTWDSDQKAFTGFGLVKTAAIEQRKNPYTTGGLRPCYCIFDILYLNDKDLTNYTLRDRRKALKEVLIPNDNLKGRFELQEYHIKKYSNDIEPMLREVVAIGAEGLVLKNPRSAYRLNERNDDWLKVKPEYMQELGESLDCIVIGGYWGTGRRQGTISSFLCGLFVTHDRESSDLATDNNNLQKTHSFFKVGGGFKADDYAKIRHRTDGKWIDWNRDKPPSDWIELAGGKSQYERPDVWIKPQDSLVLQVKAAQVTTSDQFRTYMTLRFPRFTAIRSEKSWKTALSIQEFKRLESRVRDDVSEKKLQVDNSRRKRVKRGDSKQIKVAGGTIDDVSTPYAGPATKIFEGLTFWIMSDSLSPRKSKPEIEQFVKANGAAIRQTFDAVRGTICIADRRVVKAAALEKRGDFNIVRPQWLFDCVEQSETDLGMPESLLPYEPKHMLFSKADETQRIKDNVDEYGDSFSRDVSVAELRELLDEVEPAPREWRDMKSFRQQLEVHGRGMDPLRGWVFEGLTVFFDDDPQLEETRESMSIGSQAPDKLKLGSARMTAMFAGAKVVKDISDHSITHVVSMSRGEALKHLREKSIHGRRKIPRIVDPDWVLHSWDEETLLSEERYAVY